MPLQSLVAGSGLAEVPEGVLWLLLLVMVVLSLCACAACALGGCWAQDKLKRGATPMVRLDDLQFQVHSVDASLSASSAAAYGWNAPAAAPEALPPNTGCLRTPPQQLRGATWRFVQPLSQMDSAASGFDPKKEAKLVSTAL